mmetsp:Transcript_11812/g.18190  ORF Transcript_11812/g.18190 Transcript_11812/m.18190 type:complete len:130 (-) Transcript_11812:561-950(-)
MTNGMSGVGGSIAKGLGPLFAGCLVSFSYSVWGGSLLIWSVIGVLGAMVYNMNCVIGQYDGYTQEQRAPLDSNTPTYAAVQLSIDNERLEGVPFVLVAGKATWWKFVFNCVTTTTTRCQIRRRRNTNVR